MKPLQSNQIRDRFIDYFFKLGHETVSSSSLIPPSDDTTLLFTNSGMVQFKDYLLGAPAPYPTATSVQRCMRAGGKHNDLENVGYTKRHHTFFEMLGNFSFGDYFKKEAIRYAWDFLTKTLSIPKDRLWVTVFQGDEETQSIWLKEIGIDHAQLSQCGEEDNFWQMGDVGPCGPCTEVFYDHGSELSGAPPGSGPDTEGDRYVEIWNLVFMQYSRDAAGVLHPLSKPCVDTGMGLERIAAVMQGVHDNFETDLFLGLFDALALLVNDQNFHDVSMRVIVDHIRSAAFLIADGVVPSNEGRGYVLRRIIRRAVRHGYRLGQQQPFFYRLTQALSDILGTVYPLLIDRQTFIEQTIKTEEEQFSGTLSRGLKILAQETQTLTTNIIPGDLIFYLYDTFGFPKDLTADVAREQGFTIDLDGFDKAMTAQKKRSQKVQAFTMDKTQQVYVNGNTQFLGYDALTAQGIVQAILKKNKTVTALKAGEQGKIALNLTPLYAESGGQVSDTGYLYFEGGYFEVSEVKRQGDVYLHIGKVLKGILSVKDSVRAEVDQVLRQAITCNHSATHLLHEALRRVLGDHVIQQGSLVEAKRLRFDFAHAQAVTDNEIEAVEQLVNEQIRANFVSKVDIMSPKQAYQSGAIALFGERYGEQVRVLQLGDFSKEICGGTHVNRTGDIGLFKILSESACASGVRRIEAVTGQTALQYIASQAQNLTALSQLFKTSPDLLLDKAKQCLHQLQDSQKALTQLKMKLAKQMRIALSDQIQTVGHVKIVSIALKAADPELMRYLIEAFKKSAQDECFAIILGSVEGKKVHLLAGVTQACLTYFDANTLLNYVAEQVGGRGGGRPDMSQGAGNQPEYLEQALHSAAAWVSNRANPQSNSNK